MIALGKILVATDFSAASATALAYAGELARTFGARLRILHVVENTLTRTFGPDGYIVADPDLQRDIETSARCHLNALLSEPDRDMLGAESVIVASNSPAMAIADYAREEQVDLIVMGTHGRGAVAHLLLGSVAERVVRIAPCPVLTVRHPEREFVQADALVAVASA